MTMSTADPELHDLERLYQKAREAKEHLQVE
jgi:hypothetical protein